jgi:ABC-2 type transport system permease protein
MRKYLAFLRVNLQNAVAYRGPMMIWLISNMVTLIIFVSLWLSSDIIGGTVAGYSKNELVTYYLVGLLLQWIVGWYPSWIKNEIKSGDLVGTTLSKPLVFYWKVFFIEMGWHLISVWAGLLAVIFMGYFLFSYLTLTITPLIIIESIFAITVAIFITFTTFMCMGLSAFWLTTSDALDGLFWASRSIIGGEAIPIALLPAGLLGVIKFLPFRYMYSFPLEIVLGKLAGKEIVFGFTVGIIWILILVIIYKTMWSKGTKAYTSAGV